MKLKKRIIIAVLIVLAGILCGAAIYLYNQSLMFTLGGFTYNISKKEATIVAYTGTKHNLKIPDRVLLWKVTRIGEGAFFENDVLETVTFGKNIERIEPRAFLRNVNLKMVSFNDGLKVIRGASFSGCSSLEEIYIPESVEVIRRDAFYKCEQLKEISCNANAWEIDAYAFQETAWWNQSENDILLLNDHILIACLGIHEEIIIPEGVQYIAYGAFEECRCNRIIFPDSIIRMNESRFPDDIDEIEIFFDGQSELIHLNGSWGRVFK